MSVVLPLFPAPARAGRTLPEEGFDCFWQFYPRKVARKAAQAAWARLKPAERAQALAAVPAFHEHWRALLEAGKGREFCPHAATWLNQGRWEDFEDWQGVAAGPQRRADGRTVYSPAALAAMLPDDEVEARHG